MYKHPPYFTHQDPTSSGWVLSLLSMVLTGTSLFGTFQHHGQSRGGTNLPYSDTLVGKLGLPSPYLWSSYIVSTQESNKNIQSELKSKLQKYRGMSVFDINSDPLGNPCILNRDRIQKLRMLAPHSALMLPQAHYRRRPLTRPSSGYRLLSMAKG